MSSHAITALKRLALFTTHSVNTLSGLSSSAAVRRRNSATSMSQQPLADRVTELEHELKAAHAALEAALAAHEKDRQRLTLLERQAAFNQDEQRLEDAKRSAATRRWRVSGVPALTGALITFMALPPAVMALCGVGPAGFWFAIAGGILAGSLLLLSTLPTDPFLVRFASGFGVLALLVFALVFMLLSSLVLTDALPLR